MNNEIRRLKRLAVLLRQTRGGAALEFAIVAVPFMTFLLVLFQVGLDFYYQTALDFAVAHGARAVQTGAAQAEVSADSFKKDYVCPAVQGLLNCPSITVTAQLVLPTSDYYQTQFPSPLNAAGVVSLSTYTSHFPLGGPNSLMLVQAVLESPSLTGRLVPGLYTYDGSSVVHVTTSTTAFTNENF